MPMEFASHVETLASSLRVAVAHLFHIRPDGTQVVDDDAGRRQEIILRDSTCCRVENSLSVSSRFELSRSESRSAGPW